MDWFTSIGQLKVEGIPKIHGNGNKRYKGFRWFQGEIAQILQSKNFILKPFETCMGLTSQIPKNSMSLTNKCEDHVVLSAVHFKRFKYQSNACSPSKLLISNLIQAYLRVGSSRGEWSSDFKACDYLWTYVSPYHPVSYVVGLCPILG